MDISVLGSGGVRGWPEPGCRCAACQRARSAGTSRGPARLVIDGTVRLEGPRVALVDGRGGWAGGERAEGGEWPEGTVREMSGYRIGRLAGGWDVTAPDGTRLLAAAGPVTAGITPAVPAGTCYDAALLDLASHPAQLGWLRACGAAGPQTLVAALFADHRVSSERELARRCRIWRAVLPGDGDTLTVPAPGLAVPGRVGPWRALVLGGARSGKSAEAELRVAAEPEVTYVATGPAPGPQAGLDWAARIAAHRARRPAWWHTAETTDLAGILRQARGAVLVDSITTWLAAVMDDCGAWDGTAASAARLRQRTAGVVAAWRQAGGCVVAVSDETGLGIVPETPSGRMFRDELGQLNQVLAGESDEFIVVIAGRSTTISDLLMSQCDGGASHAAITIRACPACLRWHGMGEDSYL